jgi:gliding motility-associated-like protein
LFEDSVQICYICRIFQTNADCMRPFFFPLFVLFIFLIPQTLFAQSNNNCSGAILIADPSNFCSPVGGGTTLGATASSQLSSSCFSGTMRDVWYRFTAVASEVTIVINGNTELTPGGTLLQPSVGLYSGNCNNLSEIACNEDGGFIFGDNIVELRRSGLTPGTEYFIRVGGVFAGTFQYCVRNFAFGGGVSGDCPTAVVLCDKSSFNVQSVTGPGSNDGEMEDAPCLQDAITTAEQNSTWYVFTAANNGTLEFTLTPNNPDDDLDFVLYRLPNGPSNCSGKQVLRCMASGEEDIPPNTNCIGPTGLNATSTDLSEPPGCPPTSDRFLKALDMVAGATYALGVNNFSSSGNGFQLTWGGTGQFRGPRAGIKTNDPDNKICIGQTLIVSDSSTTNNTAISSFRWSFGADATPSTANGSGPFSVSYQTPGVKIITLTLKTTNGCEVTASRRIEVINCCNLVPNVVVSDTSNCRVRAILRVQNAVAPLKINWSNGQVGGDILLLTQGGTYTVTVEDAQGCSGTASFVANLPVPPVATVAVTNACRSASAALNITGGAAPLAIQWSTGATGTALNNLTSGTYSVTVRDSRGCADTAAFVVSIPPAVDIAVTTAIGCPDDGGAKARAIIRNGKAPYQITWSNGQTDSVATKLTAGNYTAIVTDSLGCRDTVAFTVANPTVFSAAFPKDTTIVAGGRAVLTITSPVSGATATWTAVGNQNFSGLSVTVEPDSTTTYAVTASFNNCRLRDSVKVTVIFDVFEMPNVFTPDGDQINDQFGPVLSGYDQLELQIWTRWGELVFNEPTKARWDGTVNGIQAPTDVYIYRIRVRKRDGVESTKTGEVTLLR